jgi:hypothetical protein
MGGSNRFSNSNDSRLCGGEEMSAKVYYSKESDQICICWPVYKKEEHPITQSDSGQYQVLATKVELYSYIGTACEGPYLLTLLLNKEYLEHNFIYIGEFN